MTAFCEDSWLQSEYNKTKKPQLTQTGTIMPFVSDMQNMKFDRLCFSIKTIYFHATAADRKGKY